MCCKNNDVNEWKKCLSSTQTKTCYKGKIRAYFLLLWNYWTVWNEIWITVAFFPYFNINSMLSRPSNKIYTYSSRLWIPPTVTFIKVRWNLGASNHPQTMCTMYIIGVYIWDFMQIRINWNEPKRIIFNQFHTHTHIRLAYCILCFYYGLNNNNTLH